ASTWAERWAACLPASSHRSLARLVSPAAVKWWVSSSGWRLTTSANGCSSTDATGAWSFCRLPRSSVPYARILHQRMLEPADGLRRATSVEQQVCSREPLERRSQLCFGPLRHWSDKLVAKFSAKKRSDFAISLAAAPSRSRRAISDACKVAGI